MHRIDRATNPGTTDPTIAIGIFCEVLLMIFLCKIKRNPGSHFGRDRAKPTFSKPRTVVIQYTLSMGNVRIVIKVKRRSVLRADIVSLTHALRRVVLFTKDGKEPFERCLAGIVDHFNDFGVTRLPAANFMIRRIGCCSTRVTNRCSPYSGLLPKEPLGSPKTTHTRKEAAVRSRR